MPIEYLMKQLVSAMRLGKHRSITSIDIHFHDTASDCCLDLFFSGTRTSVEDQEAEMRIRNWGISR